MRPPNPRGFTLIEMLVVIAIIGLLALIVFASIGGARKKGVDTAIAAQVKQLNLQMQKDYAETGTYPGLSMANTLSSAAPYAAMRQNIINQGSVLTVVTDAALAQYALFGRLATDPYKFYCADSRGAVSITSGANATTCAAATSCNNGLLDPGEACDAGNLNGQTCLTKGFAGGTLACNNTCTGFITTSCTALTCLPASQSVTVYNQQAHLSVSGGNGLYTWTPPPSGSPTWGSGSTFDVTFSTVGTQQVTVTQSGGPSTQCTVVVNPYCGDGIVHAPEQCDEAWSNSDTYPATCSSTCTLNTWTPQLGCTISPQNSAPSYFKQYTYTATPLYFSPYTYGWSYAVGWFGGCSGSQQCTLYYSNGGTGPTVTAYGWEGQVTATCPNPGS